MAIAERLITMVAQWAKNAQTNIPNPPIPGIAYRNNNLSTIDIENGQAYDKVYDSARYNQIDYCTTGLVQSMEQYGILPWSSLTNYPESALCMGLDGVIYQALQASGPANKEAYPTTDTEYWESYATRVSSSGSGGYELCEFYSFRNPYLREGFQPAQGGVITNAANLYPKVWEFLQTTEGGALCVSEASWQELTSAPAGWNGIGGAPFYAPDWSLGSLRLPDLRGMYAEGAGLDGLNVGMTHLDSFQGHYHEITISSQTAGGIGAMKSRQNNSAFSKGSLGGPLSQTTGFVAYGSQWHAFDIFEDHTNGYGSPRVGRITKPRAWGALACVYLGVPE